MQFRPDRKLPLLHHAASHIVRHLTPCAQHCTLLQTIIPHSFNKRAQSQIDFARVADQLQSIAAQMHSLPVQSQPQQAQTRMFAKFHNEIRDVKSRLRVVENQVQESSKDSIQDVKSRMEILEGKGEQLQTAVECIENTVGSIQKQLGSMLADLTVWKA